jgi:tripartite ATP-independent transporter DctP family solute receptor
MKKKVIAILALVFMMINLTGCTTSKNNIYLDMIDNKNPDKKVLFLAEAQQVDHPTTKGDYEFAKLVNQRTNGRIEIKVIAKSGLGSEKDTLAQTQMGAIDFIRVSVSPISNYSSTMRILSLPYLYRDSNHMWAVLDGPIGQQALNDIQNANLIGLAFYDSGARSFYNNKKEIKTLSDLQSLRMRVQESELMKDLISSLGATPIAMDASQVVQTLALGQIDGAENNPATYVTSNHFNLAKYYTFDEHSRIPDILLASSKVMQTLSKEDQEIIKQAAVESVKIQKAEWKNYDAEMLNKMKENGVKITELDAASIEEFKNAVKPVYDKYTGGNKDLITQIEKTRS